MNLKYQGIALVCSCAFLRVEHASGMLTSAFASSLDSFTETIEWMESYGEATINAELHESSRDHGGAAIRGVISGSQLSRGEVILKIPSNFWITTALHPEATSVFKNLNNSSGSCSRIDPEDQMAMAMASNLALEASKEHQSSFWHYMRNLPSHDDYQSFYPRWIESSVLQEFRDLPLAAVLAAGQEKDAELESCYKSQWQHQTSLLSGITWDDIKLGLARYRTRCYMVSMTDLHLPLESAIDLRLKEESASITTVMIPASDMFNVARRDNTLWGTMNGSWVVSAATGINADSELYESYCDACHNAMMVQVWGVYLEDNINSLRNSHGLKCSQGVGSLREVAERMLDLSSIGQALQNGWRAPRCQSDAVKTMNQGPLRCSLARLAFESCANAWGHKGFAKFNVSSEALLSVDDQASTLTAYEEAKLGDNLAIGAVPSHRIKENGKTWRSAPNAGNRPQMSVSHHSQELNVET